MRGLGNRIRQLLAQFAHFWMDLLEDFWGNKFPRAFRRLWVALGGSDWGGVTTTRTLVALGFPPAVAQDIDAALRAVPPFLRPFVAVPLLAHVVGAYFELALTDDRMQREWQVEKGLLPEKIAFQIREQLKYVAEQARASWEAEKPLLPERIMLQTLESLKYVQRQLEAQLNATIAVRPQGLAPAAMGEAVAKGLLDEGKAEDLAARAGFPNGLVRTFAETVRPRLTPLQYVDAFRRKIIDETTFRQKMKLLGYDDTDIEILVKQSLFYPTPSDLVTWQAKEVYEPDSIKKYGLDEELDRLNKEAFYKGGLDDEQIRNYWIAHWQHPPFTQIAEMFVRDILVDPQGRKKYRPGTREWAEYRRKQEQEFYEWFRLVEIPPYWRDKLIQMVYQPYTRVDTRRMYDMRVLSEEEVLRDFLDQGYDLEHAKNLTLWVKLDTTVPDIIARYKNGWIDEATALREIMALGLSAERATELMQQKIKKVVKPERVQKERDLTASEIIRGVKKKILTPEQAIQYFRRMGYDEDEARLKLMIGLGAGSSPETPAEFEHWVETYRKAVGLEAKEIPPQLLELEKRLAELNAKIAEAQAKNAPQHELDRLNADKARLEYQISQMRARLQSTG